MLFTTVPMTPNGTTPDFFKDRGNPTDAPSKLSDVLLFALKAKESPEWDLFTWNIGKHLIATAAGSIVAGPNNSISLKLTESQEYRPAPRVGFAIESRSQDTTDRLSQLGFSKTTQGRKVIYTGVLTKANVGYVVSLAPEMESYVPFGTATINGHLAFNIGCNLVQLVYRTITSPALAEDMSCLSFNAGFVASKAQKESVAKYFNRNKKCADGAQVASHGIALINGGQYIAHPSYRKTPQQFRGPVSDKSSPGIYLPYYPGMLLDDRHSPLDIIRNRFQSCLGETEQEVIELSTILNKGWRTLAQTNAGQELSHMLYTIDLALKAGAQPVPYITSAGEYLGTVLLGYGFKIVKYGKTHMPVEHAILSAEMSEFDSHNSALEKICQLLATIPVKDNNDPISLAPSNILTPRQIHNVLRQHSVPTNTVTALREQFSRTNFRQTYLDGKSFLDLSTAINAISTKTYLPDNSPMNINSQFMFSDDIVCSTLTAFGHIAPSFLDATGKTVQIGSPTDTLLTKKKIDGKLILPRGVPVFLMPLPSAIPHWRNMIKNSIIRFKSNDRGFYINVSKSFAGDDGHKLAAKLAEAFGASSSTKAEKRKRDDKDVDVDTQVKASKGKKMRRDQLASLFGVGVPEEPVSSDEEMEEPDAPANKD